MHGQAAWRIQYHVVNQCICTRTHCFHNSLGQCFPFLLCRLCKENHVFLLRETKTFWYLHFVLLHILVNLKALVIKHVVTALVTPLWREMAEK